MKLQWQEKKDRVAVEAYEAHAEKVTALIHVMPDGAHLVSFAIDGAKTIRQDKWLAEKIARLIEEAI